MLCFNKQLIKQVIVSNKEKYLKKTYQLSVSAIGKMLWEAKQSFYKILSSLEYCHVRVVGPVL